MTNIIQSIALDKLVAHPDNPNRMSRANFSKLVRNIELTGRYEPLIVRPHRERSDCFEIVNGHHRCRALTKLGYKTADCIVWDIDDEETDVLLATLNRLGGTDELGKKLALLKRLKKKMGVAELSKLLPQTTKQIERLTNLKIPTTPARINANSFANPVVFFVNDAQQQVIESALSLATKQEILRCAQNDKLCFQIITKPKNKMTKAAKRAAALAQIAGDFLNHSKFNSRT